MKAQKGLLGAVWKEQLNSMDPSMLRTSFVGTVSSRLTSADSSLDDFLFACQLATQRDYPFSELCSAINALQITKDLVPPT